MWHEKKREKIETHSKFMADWELGEFVPLKKAIEDADEEGIMFF